MNTTIVARARAALAEVLPLLARDAAAELDTLTDARRAAARHDGRPLTVAEYDALGRVAEVRARTIAALRAFDDAAGRATTPLPAWPPTPCRMGRVGPRAMAVVIEADEDSFQDREAWVLALCRWASELSAQGAA